MNDYEAALIGAQLERAQWDLFRDLSGESGREMIDESERMRHDFARHVQTMLTSDDDRERVASASWVSKHAAELAYRSAIMRRMFSLFMRVDCPPVIVRVSTPEDDPHSAP